jgi:hypothetical protein
MNRSSRKNSTVRWELHSKISVSVMSAGGYWAFLRYSSRSVKVFAGEGNECKFVPLYTSTLLLVRVSRNGGILNVRWALHSKTKEVYYRTMSSSAGAAKPNMVLHGRNLCAFVFLAPNSKRFYSCLALATELPN